MRRALVAGNWKMNGTRATACELAGALARAFAGNAVSKAQVDVAVCPPYPYLAEVAGVLAGSSVALGAQDVSAERSGAFTGDVAAEMLIDVGCTYVLVGHSERRHGLAESDAQVAAKFARAIDGGLMPVLCVGETLAEREAGHTKNIVARQIDAVFKGREFDSTQSFVLAYEPVWAIGTGLSATPEQAQQVHSAIRAQLHSNGVDADGTRVLYGGSVNASNASELFAMQDIDGGLIGGASLKADDFLVICHAAGG